MTGSRIYNLTANGTFFTKSPVRIEDNALTEIYAIAYDEVGNSAESGKIKVMHDNLPPEIQPFYPGNGMTINEANPVFNAKVSDAGSGLVQGSQKIMINGIQYDQNGGVGYTGSANDGEISLYYLAGLEPSADRKPRAYDISAQMIDLAGNMADLTWRFYYDPNSPLITSIIPADNSFITDTNPVITVSFYEKIKSMELNVENDGKLNGLFLLENINNQTFRFRNASLSFADEALVHMRITDMGNNSAVYTTRFTVDNGMPYLELEKTSLTNLTKISVQGVYNEKYVSKIELLSPGYKLINYPSGADDAGSFIFDGVSLALNARNSVKVKITDFAGNYYEDSFNVTQDSVSPTLSWSIDHLTNAATVPFSGTTDGIKASLFLDGNFIKDVRIIGGSFADSVVINDEGMHAVEIAAYDEAGNVRRDSENVVKDSIAPSINIDGTYSTIFDGSIRNGENVRIKFNYDDIRLVGIKTNTMNNFYYFN